MLKKIRLLFLGLVVIAGSACVTPTHASSASSVVLAYIQTTGSTGAKDELIVIYNNGPTEVDITNWCLVNKSYVAFACFTGELANGGEIHTILPPYKSAAIASHSYLAAGAIGPEMVALEYDSLNQSSGSIVSSSDTISLMNAHSEVMDVRSWSTTPATGKAWARIQVLPGVYATGNDTADWTSVAWAQLPVSTVEKRLVIPGGEVDPNPDPEPEVPEVPESPPITTEPAILITEIFPNAAGADAGKEYIELHNPSATTPQSLDGLTLHVGVENPKQYDLPTGTIIPPGGYVTVTDDVAGFTLVNTNGGVQLYRGDTPLGERIEYTSPKDDYSWALIDGIWQYTNVLTPGVQNVASLIETKEASAIEEEVPKACAANQFRNPETGRCKLIATTTKGVTPCKEGQERNIETGRCRTIAAAKEPAPCKEGQERNPETNRCRNITKMSSVDYGVKGVQEKAGAQLSWYYWVAIIGIVALILAYAAWEWRDEILSVGRRMKASFAKK